MTRTEWFNVTVFGAVVLGCFSIVAIPAYDRHQERVIVEERRELARTQPDFQNRLLSMIPVDRPMPWRNMQHWLHEATGDTISIFNLQDIRICPYQGCLDDSYEVSYLFERHPTKLGYWRRTE